MRYKKLLIYYLSESEYDTLLIKYIKHYQIMIYLHTLTLYFVGKRESKGLTV